jgi:hypothetical protein
MRSRRWGLARRGSKTLLDGAAGNRSCWIRTGSGSRGRRAVGAGRWCHAAAATFTRILEQFNRKTTIVFWDLKSSCALTKFFNGCESFRAGLSHLRQHDTKTKHPISVPLLRFVKTCTTSTVTLGPFFTKNFANVITTCRLQIGLFLLIAAIQKEPRQVYERASAVVTARLRKYKGNFIFTFTRVAYHYVK